MDEPQSELITAEDLARMFNISLATLYRQLKHGVPSKRNRGMGVDLRAVEDVWVGGKRFWYRASAEALLAQNK